MDNMIEFGNPYGAGRYGYIRSAEDSEAMMSGTEARFDSDHNRWFEYMGCGYACGRDGQALQEADDYDLYYFHKDHPKINCKESFHDLEYGNTRNEVAYAYFLLMEYVGNKHRTFSFHLENITMQEAKEYIAAVESWHCTGELNIGPFSSCPCYGHWEDT